MNYLHIYVSLIEKRRQFPLNKNPKYPGEIEYHHVIPIKCGGEATPRKEVYNNTKTNLIGLTIKEHFVAHHLLAKIYCNTQYAESAINAFNMMAITRYNKIKISLKTYEILKAWNKIDPPSEVEKLRNDTVEKIQGNRNPFVDYPKLVNNLF